MTLTPKQEKYALERANGATNPEAAATVGVAERTGRYWQAEPAVAARIAALQDEIVAGAVAILKGNATRAARRLVELLNCRDNYQGVGSVSLGAVRDHLDRVGLKPADQATVTHQGNPAAPVVWRVVYDDPEPDAPPAPPAPGTT